MLIKWVQRLLLSMVTFVETIGTFPTMATQERLGFGTWLLVVQLEVLCKVGPDPYHWNTYNDLFTFQFQ